MTTVEPDHCREYLPQELDPGNTRQLTTNPAESVERFISAGSFPPWDPAGLYVADHPQRFLSAEHADQIEGIRKTLKGQSGKP